MEENPPRDGCWDRYERLQHLGAGTFGNVYLVKRLLPDSDATPAEELLVVKRTSMLGQAEQLVEANATEVSVLAMLSHPNILRYVEHFVDDESHLNLVTEHCSSGDLQQLVNTTKQAGGTVAVRDAVFVTFQILQALAYMHSQEVMHRDLKPSNIFLCPGLVVKVGDFGIAKMVSVNSMASTMVGTPFYLSPEVCGGQPYTHPSDMWSAGCVLYELFSLEKPFRGNNILAIAQAIHSGVFDPLPGSCPPRFTALVSSLLCVDPAERATARSLLQSHFAFSSPLEPAVRQMLDDTFVGRHRAPSAVSPRAAA